MKLQDIIAFAKAGYKPSDVKELLSLEGAGENDVNNSEDNNGNPNVADRLDTENSGSSSDNISDTNTDKDNNRENNEELEKYKNEIEKLKNQVKLLQEANKNKDISNKDDNRTLDEVIIDIFNNL